MSTPEPSTVPAYLTPEGHHIQCAIYTSDPQDPPLPCDCRGPAAPPEPSAVPAQHQRIHAFNLAGRDDTPDYFGCSCGWEFEITNDGSSPEAAFQAHLPEPSTVPVRCTCQTVTGGGRYSPPQRPCRMHGVGWSDPGGPRGVVIPPAEPSTVEPGEVGHEPGCLWSVTMPWSECTCPEPSAVEREEQR